MYFCSKMVCRMQQFIPSIVCSWEHKVELGLTFSRLVSGGGAAGRAGLEVHIELAGDHAVVELAPPGGLFAEILLKLSVRRDDIGA